MSRLLLTLVLSCAVPVCAWAQQTAPSATADSPTSAPNVAKKKSRNPFGAVMAELTRAAQEQAEAQRTKPAASASAPATPAHAATPAAPAEVLPVALADSNGR